MFFQKLPDSWHRVFKEIFPKLDNLEGQLLKCQTIFVVFHTMITQNILVFETVHDVS